MTSLYALAEHALPAAALCGLDESEGTSVDRIARALEASGCGSAAAHRTAILRALGEHLRAQYTDARNALQWLATIDRRLAKWGACACAREALRYVPAGEERPLRAIETTERWLAGQATLDDVQLARDAAYEALRAADAATTYAATANAAVYAAVAAAAASAYASASAYAAAAYAGWGTPKWTTAYAAEIARLVGVIADALPGIPPEPIQ